MNDYDNELPDTLDKLTVAFAELAIAFNQNGTHNALCVITKDCTTFSLLDESGDETDQSAFIYPETPFNEAEAKYYEYTELLCLESEYEGPEDYKLSPDQLHRSMQAYYAKYGTKGEN